MLNPIAFLYHPSRVLSFVLGLLCGYAAITLTSFEGDCGEASDASDVSRVELLR